MIISKEKQVKKYEELKRSLTDAENPTFRSFELLDGSSSAPNAYSRPSTKALPHLGDKGDEQRSLADFDQGEETSSRYMHHLVSLLDRLIIEVDTPTYRIGLLSRYRIRSYIYRARSKEFNQLYSLHGSAALEQTRKVLDLSVDEQSTTPDYKENILHGRKRRRGHEESLKNTRTARKTSSRYDLNEFWIPGDGIHREVLQKNICPFLGPEAISIPYMFEVITTLLFQMFEN